METFDISGLQVGAAHQYILDITIHKKALEARKGTLNQDLDLWKSRVTLGETSHRQDLAAAAQVQVDRITKDIGTITLELEEVVRGLEIMKEQLRSPALAAGAMRDSAEALLTELEELTQKGTGVPPQAPGSPSPAQLAKEVDALGADKALEDLKRSLGLIPEKEMPREDDPPQGTDS